MRTEFRIGTAGWSIPKIVRDDFFGVDVVKPDHLAAYSSEFAGVELNSPFHKDPLAKTYEKWATATPDYFRFSVKLAKRFTHLQKLKVDATDLAKVLGDIQHLREKLGTILIQIPPKLIFDQESAEDFFATFRELHDGLVVFEARHESWANREATRVLEDHRIGRVIADPDKLGPAAEIRNAGIAYFRLHGSPKVYYDAYDVKALEAWVTRVYEARKTFEHVWCIFDNTAQGFATPNAVDMQRKLRSLMSNTSMRP